jgi:hypothetical protein
MASLLSKNPKPAVFKHKASLRSVTDQRKNKIFKINLLKAGKKVTSVLAIAVILTVLVSAFAFLPKEQQNNPIEPQNTESPTASPTAVPERTILPTPSDPFSQITRYISGFGNAIVQAVTPRTPGLIENSSAMNSSSLWRQVATNAWKYFQPDIGVDPNTGLPRSGINAPFFTDWDLGVYIQAVIDANTTGVVGADGPWGSSARLEKVVKFLETRELNNASYPYWFYQSSDGKDYHTMSDLSNSTVDYVDTGRLFVSLNNLKTFNNSLTQRINTIVLSGQNYNRSNYSALIPGIYSNNLASNSIYAYYFFSGFASFWPNQLSSLPNRILDNILASATVTTNNVTLPISAILCDPLLCSVFELSSNSKLMTIIHQVYLAHEAYFNVTGIYRAFSEGASLSDNWVYEWVVYPDNRTWVVLDENGQPFNMSPIVYTKVALGFLAIYNTTYSYDLNVYLEKSLPPPSSGYCEGVTEEGAQLTGTGSNTNGLIIGAAKYALQNNL